MPVSLWTLLVVGSFSWRSWVHSLFCRCKILPSRVGMYLAFPSNHSKLLVRHRIHGSFIGLTCQNLFLGRKREIHLDKLLVPTHRRPVSSWKVTILLYGCSWLVFLNWSETFKRFPELFFFPIILVIFLTEHCFYADFCIYSHLSIINLNVHWFRRIMISIYSFDLLLT